MGLTEKWKHDRQCLYCGTSASVIQKRLRQKGCKHYRGGKTASDRRRR